MATKTPAVEESAATTDEAAVDPVTGNGPAAHEANRQVRGECVVDDGTRHIGRAVNGVVCSAHAARYRADGTRRASL